MNKGRVQESMRDILRVLSAAGEVQPDLERALFLIKNAPIPTFWHRTLLEVIRTGRADDAVEYLRSVSAQGSSVDSHRLHRPG